MKGWLTFLFAIAGSISMTATMLARGSAKDSWTTWVVIGAAGGAVLGRLLAVLFVSMAALAQRRLERSPQPERQRAL